MTMANELNPLDEENKILKTQNQELQNKADEAMTQMGNLSNQESSAFDILNQRAEEYKKSMETPEMAERRRRDQRNAAMWTAVTDGIGQIFQLTHAATNPDAVPMDVVSTSAAVQQAAEKADERYEKQRDKMDQLNMQISAMRDKDLERRLSFAKTRHATIQEQIKANREQINANNERMYRQSKDDQNQENWKAEYDLKKQGRADAIAEAAKNRAHQRAMNTDNNESRERMNDADNASQQAIAAAKAAAEAAKKPSKAANDAAYETLTPEQKAAVDKAVRKAQKNGPLGDDKREEIRKKAIQDAGGIVKEDMAGF